MSRSQNRTPATRGPQNEFPPVGRKLATLGAADDAADDASRPEYMFLARESVRGLGPLRKMLYQTLKAFPNAPGVATALGAGLEPYMRPTAWNATRIGKGDTRGVVYCIEGSWFCLVEGSAAQEDMTNERRWRSAENVFVEMLIDQLVAIRPRRLVVAVFSRLVRAEEYSGKLLGAARRHVDEVHAGDLPTIVLSNEQSGTVWQVGTMLSSWERTNLLRRMTIGTLISVADGKWIRGEACLPFGYRLRSDMRVEPDVSARPAVRQMMEVLAEPGLTYREIYGRLSEAGVTSSRRVTRDPTSKGAVGDARSPSSYLKCLLPWLPVYRTGEYHFRHRNPLPGEKQLGGFVVTDDGGAGYFELLYNFGVPEGGWADPALLDAAEANMGAPRRRGGSASHRMVRPLATLRYSSEGRLYRLHATERSYELESRDDDTGEPFSSWKADDLDIGQRLATMNAEELHLAIATTVMEAIRDGVRAEQLDGWARVQKLGGARLVDVRANRLAMLDRQLRQAHRRYDALRRAAAAAALRDSSCADDLQSDFLADAEAALLEARRIEGERRAAESLPSRTFDFGVGFEAEAAFLARAMANLAEAPRLVHTDVARSLAEVLRDIRFQVNGDRVRWSCSVVVPADGGAVRLFVSGEVPNRSFSYRHSTVRRRSSFQRGNVLLERILWNGERLEDAARFQGVSHLRSWRIMMQLALQDRGLPVRASQVLLYALVPDVGRVVFAHLDGREVPAEIDPDWAAYIVRVYSDPTLKWVRQWSHDVSDRQAMIDAIKAAGGVAYREQLESLIVPRSQIFQFSRFHGTASRAPGIAPSVQRVGSWDRSGGGIGQGLSLISCPHDGCGGYASIALWVPETGRGLKPATSTICPDCRRLPVLGSPRFPDEYLHLPELGVGVGPQDHPGKRT